ncbi:aminotransferase class V-fold PLP-dependent enzyme [Streptomyces sp. NPDC002952]|uniref:aminotransferase class V-fold PLP-dependent enzyme n=1 Tax=Streptomyces sp. NPDC002952 TaxID=3364673 RepID=UPI0036C30C49
MKLHEARRHFPVLSTGVYLNSNSTGAVPAGVQQVLEAYWRTLEQWRDEVWEDWFAAIDAYADVVAVFIGAPPGSVVTDISVSNLLGRIASALDFAGDRHTVVTTALEFPTVPAVWRGFGRYGARLVQAGGEGPAADEDALIEAIDERTQLVCVTHAAYHTGALLDLKRISARAREAGALLAVDAYQSVGTVPVDVEDLGVDFLLGGAHKWLCGASTAFAYARPDIAARLRPAATGWLAGGQGFGVGSPVGSAQRAHVLRSGTPLALGPLISRIGMDMITRVGIESIRAHSLACTRRIIDRAGELGLGVLTPNADHRRAGIVALSFPGDKQAVKNLAARGFVCSWRGSLRVAPHFYNTFDEVDAFMDAVAELV